MFVRQYISKNNFFDSSCDSRWSHVGIHGCNDRRRYVIIWKLCDKSTSQIFLNCEKLEKFNYQTIAKLFDDSMSFLWPNGVKQHENVTDNH